MQQMLANLRARREDERGFTLIELMVVVLIIAILIAIAIPTFLGAKTRAQDKAAQSSLRNALTNAKGIYTDADSYGTTAALVTALTAAEPSLTFQTTASTNAKQISVSTSGTTVVAMAAQSADGKCYVIADDAIGPGTLFQMQNAGGSCTPGTLPTSSTVAVTSNAVNSTTNYYQSW